MAHADRVERMTSHAARILALLATVPIAVAGCSANSLTKEGNGAGQDPELTAAPAGFESYYSQKIEWRQCTEDEIVHPMLSAPKDMNAYQCATVEAPMNWDDANSESIELGVARHLNRQKDNAPALFFNLGGPGGGAVDSISAVVENILSGELVQSFQIVALDPRGVGASTPIVCLTDEERDFENEREDDLSALSTEELVAFADQEFADYGNKCLEKNGEVLGYVDSDSATRDFDMMRALLGQEKLDYIGFSYGTVIGAYYAELFPDTVGRLVLDGAVDPALNINELSAAQLEGMENSLYHWIEQCQEGNKCPLSGDLESGKQQMIEFFEDLAEEPLPTGDPERPVNSVLAYTAVIGSLYSTENYGLLQQAMSLAEMGDGTMLLFLADYFNSRGDDGVYIDNSSDAFTAINALDYLPVGTPEEWEIESADLAERFPVLGGDFGFASAGLEAWPVQTRVARHRITAPGVPEILVIGTTNDPATPYSMAQTLAADLESGVLMTVEGWNHTAYSKYADKCVVNAVDRFLLDGTVPDEGTVCPG